MRLAQNHRGDRAKQGQNQGPSDLRLRVPGSHIRAPRDFRGQSPVLSKAEANHFRDVLDVGQRHRSRVAIIHAPRPLTKPEASATSLLVTFLN